MTFQFSSCNIPPLIPPFLAQSSSYSKSWSSQTDYHLLAPGPHTGHALQPLGFGLSCRSQNQPSCLEWTDENSSCSVLASAFASSASSPLGRHHPSTASISTVASPTTSLPVIPTTSYGGIYTIYDLGRLITFLPLSGPSCHLVGDFHISSFS